MEIYMSNDIEVNFSDMVKIPVEDLEKNFESEKLKKETK